jgi:hypothetical protein
MHTSFWAVFFAVAVPSVVLAILGVMALSKCRPEDIPEALRALFGRK